MKDYQTHVFTSTYTADVSGVCSAMYELGGMSVIHDPSGCNSTYSTHDEPRWFDGKSLMFISGLDEMTAVLGDDEVIIKDIAAAAADLKPEFITLCGGSIPHIIAFDFKGTAHLIEKRCNIPVVPVATDGLKSYISGVGMALTEWIKRFADVKVQKTPELSVNLMGVTPLDFSINGNVEKMRETFEKAGIKVNCCAAMGESFESMRGLYAAHVNVVVSSAGRRPARYMEKTGGIPRVEGLPIGEAEAGKLIKAVREAASDGKNKIVYDEALEHEDWEVPGDGILVIGEEVFALSLADAINELPESERHGLKAYAIWPDVDEGLPEEQLMEAVKRSKMVIADPLYKVIPHDKAIKFIDFPHEAYSGRIYRKQIPVFATDEFDTAKLIK